MRSPSSQSQQPAGRSRASTRAAAAPPTRPKRKHRSAPLWRCCENNGEALNEERVPWPRPGPRPARCAQERPAPPRRTVHPSRGGGNHQEGRGAERRKGQGIDKSARDSKKLRRDLLTESTGISRSGSSPSPRQARHPHRLSYYSGPKLGPRGKSEEKSSSKGPGRRIPLIYIPYTR